MRATLAILLFVVPSYAQGADLEEMVKLRAEKLVAARPTGGLVVGVLVDGKPRTFGFGRVQLPGGSQVPDGSTIFEIGSITKGLTGALLAEAVIRGELKLDPPAQTYLPPDLILPRAGDKPITLEHLATHHSALPVEPPQLGLRAKDTANPYADFDRPKLAAMLKQVELERMPGSKYAYSNVGAGLVGVALVHASKAESFDGLLKARICRPLGMVDTAEALTGSQKARFARGHTRKGDPTAHWDFAALEASGCVRSTATDLLKLAAANMPDAKSEVATDLRASQRPRRKLDESQSVGLFWMIDHPPGKPPSVWHNGSTYGSRAMYRVVPEAKIAVVALASIEAEEVDQLVNDLCDQLIVKP